MSSIDAIQPGMQFDWERTVTDDDVQLFARVSGDVNPVHLDDAYAAGTRFGRRVAHGMLSLGFVSKVIGTQLAPEGMTAIYLEQQVRFLKPVYIGDTVRCVTEVIQVDRERRFVTLNTELANQDGTAVATGTARVLLDPHPYQPSR